ncbi:MAG: Gfo/Idh/MocA family oxidoreductase [Fimbriimonadaceae bacterium]|nr:Gfo/Idh/MocA family oxidoreductase [Fimbriimonadaceae bacterium]
MPHPCRIGILMDTTDLGLGLHGMHVAFRGLPGVEVVGLADSNPRGLEERLAVSGARRVYPSLAALLADAAPEVMVLANRSPDDHLAQIQACLEAGCHLYCEKPLAARLTEVDQIIALAERHGRQIALAHPCRQAPVWRTLRRMVADGAIGRPLTVYGRGKEDHRGGGEDLIVLGTHVLDFQAALCGQPRQVYAEVTQDGRPIVASDRLPTVEPVGPVAGDAIFATLQFDGQVRGLFESRRGLSTWGRGLARMGITVCGTAGSLTLRFWDGPPPAATLRWSQVAGAPEDDLSYQEVPVVEERVIPGAEPLDYGLLGRENVPQAALFMEAGRFAAWDLLEAIGAGRPPECSAVDARRTQEMLQGIYAAALAGRPVALPLVERRHPLEV